MVVSSITLQRENFFRMADLNAKVLDRLYTNPKTVLRKNSYFENCHQKQNSYFEDCLRREQKRKISIERTRKIFERDLMLSRQTAEEREFKAITRKNSQDNLEQAIERAKKFVFRVGDDDEDDEKRDEMPPLVAGPIRKSSVAGLGTMDSKTKVIEFIDKLEDVDKNGNAAKKISRSISVPTLLPARRKKSLEVPTSKREMATPGSMNRPRSNSVQFFITETKSIRRKSSFPEYTEVSNMPAVGYRPKQYRVAGEVFDVELREDSLPSIKPQRRMSVEMKKTYKNDVF